VFPLRQALLLPRASLPLNIFEPRYLAMVEAALGNARIIGMVQPKVREKIAPDDAPPLEAVGCAGRIASFVEESDGRYLVSLVGITRFAISEELPVTTPYRQVRADYAAFAEDLVSGTGENAVDRTRLLKTLADYLEARNLTTDWDTIAGTDTETLVNALSIMSPFGAREKQALLEADKLGHRSEVLIALTEVALAQSGSSEESRLQ
ncbi:MAG: peptidase S16, partial [Rhizobiales bacterium]|nr:peptidase S16 [Hyphomicrobiales bacterium]